ncbi:N-acetylneuraminate synthase family protein [Kocuria rhizophila]|nr:N-acetylneuraminate synthase family protein [Kocuria rhizophila]
MRRRAPGAVARAGRGRAAHRPARGGRRGAPALLIAEIGNNQQQLRGARQAPRGPRPGGRRGRREVSSCGTWTPYRQAGAASDGEDLGVQYTLDLLSGSRWTPNRCSRCSSTAGPGHRAPCARRAGPALRAGAGACRGPRVANHLRGPHHHGLLRDAGSRGVPLIVSTGISSEDEIRGAVAVLREVGAPVRPAAVPVRLPRAVQGPQHRVHGPARGLGGCPWGACGHDAGIHVPVAAVARGAHVVEKHFTVDRDMEGNDHAGVPAAPRVRADGRADPPGGAGHRHAEPRRVTPGESMNRVNLATSLVAQPARLRRGSWLVRAEDVTVRSPGADCSRTGCRTGGGADAPHGRGACCARVTCAARRPARGPTASTAWGIPVRYHDARELMANGVPDFLEFHFSAGTWTWTGGGYQAERLPTAFTAHLPDLFPGDFVVDLASPDPPRGSAPIAGAAHSPAHRELVPFSRASRTAHGPHHGRLHPPRPHPKCKYPG